MRPRPREQPADAATGITRHHLPEDDRIDVSLAVCQEVPHVDDLAPRHLGVTVSDILGYPLAASPLVCIQWTTAVKSTSSPVNAASDAGRCRSIVSISSTMSTRKSRSKFTT